MLEQASRRSGIICRWGRLLLHSFAQLQIGSGLLRHLLSKLPKNVRFYHSHADALRLALHQNVCSYNTNISVIQFSQFRLSPARVFDGCPEWLAVEWRLGFDVQAQTVRVFRLTLISPIRVSLSLPLPLSRTHLQAMSLRGMGVRAKIQGCSDAA